MLDDSDQTRILLEQVDRDSPQAFGPLFDLHRNYLLGVVQMHLEPNPRFDASDVVQETHLHAHRHFEDYLQRRPMPFKLWLRKTAQQRLANLLREHGAEKRAMKRQRPLANQSSIMIARQLVGQMPSPSELVAKQQTIQQISRAVSELAIADREILLLRHVEGLSHREIALILDIEESAARKRYGRVLLRFQKQLVENEVTESDAY
jgi:RNA polymerase sigma-70 factor (ECF subfamily)